MVRVWTFTLPENMYDKRDFVIGTVVKNFDKIQELPKIMRGITETYRQWHLGSCTAMGTTHSMKSQNEKEHWPAVWLDRKDLRANMGHSLTQYDWWDYIEKAMKTTVSKWIKGTLNWNPHLFTARAWAYWTWMYRKKALHIAPLVTSIKGNNNTWKEMLDWEVKTIGKYKDWHAVMIAWYDKDWVYFYNSFGDRINKDWISNFKMSIDNFNKAISVKMINRRYFAIYDKMDVNRYAKEIELVKQAIDALTKLYKIAEPDVQQQQEQRQMWNYFKKRYNFEY